MAALINVLHNSLQVVIEVTDELDVRLLHFSSLPFHEALVSGQERRFRLVEVHATGENQDDHHGPKHTGTNPGNRLIYQDHTDTEGNLGRKLEIIQYDKVTGVQVVSHMQFINDIPVVRCWTEVHNHGSSDVGLEYVSSFALTGIAKEGLQRWDQKMKLSVPHNTWYGETQWRSCSLPELGLSPINSFSLKRIAYNNVGTWSSSQFVPMGCIENTELGTQLFWQIEHNGSWHWEISDVKTVLDDKPGQLYLQISGPTENESHWWKKLSPGESFVSVTVAVGAVKGTFESAIGAVTEYRRAIRRPNRDNEKLPVIFNDYMNCLFGDPTTVKLLPLIDAAAETGCEYFCIDAGWYSDGAWWDGVGKWLPSEVRFPGGIKEPLDYIRSKGMVPGLWLEIEVMGVKCELVNQVPDEWFFCRHGQRTIDNGRYQLDFRNPEVALHADRVIRRLVDDYGVGYIKMDYNINAGIGTETSSDSFGDGLLEHNRAYLAWLDRVFAEYPELVIENCGSGGMRMDYALLSRHSIQSSSDQTDYRKYASIAASSPSVVTPEQCAVWSYPLKDGDREEVIFNMVNALLMRIHQSGHLAEISAERRALVKEGIAYYKVIRSNIRNAVPFWPLGLPAYSDEWVSLGLAVGQKAYIAVWRLDSPKDNCVLPVDRLKGRKVKAACGYPSQEPCSWAWNEAAGSLSVQLPSRNSARLFELDIL